MDQERSEFEDLMGEFLSLVYQSEATPSKSLTLQKAEAFTAVLSYVRGLEHIIQKVKRAVGEDD